MSDPSNNGGIGFFGILTVVFITLKLTNNIDWEWWWVLSPILFWPVTLVLVATIGGIWHLCVEKEES